MLHAAPANDSAGLQRGSRFAIARPMMLKANPGYQFTDIILKGGKVAGTDAGAVWFMGRGGRRQDLCAHPVLGTQRQQDLGSA